VTSGEESSKHQHSRSSSQEHQEEQRDEHEPHRNRAERGNTDQRSDERLYERPRATGRTLGTADREIGSIGRIAESDSEMPHRRRVFRKHPTPVSPAQVWSCVARKRCTEVVIESLTRVVAA